MSSNNVKEIEDLIKIISKLPGLGPKSAKRIVLRLINKREELIKPLTNTLAQVYKKFKNIFSDAELMEVKKNEE